MKTKQTYLVTQVPKGRLYLVLRTIVVVIVAHSKAEALREAGLNAEDKDYCKPVATLLTNKVKYYI